MRIRTYKKPILPDEKIIKIVSILRKVYVFFIIWVALYVGMFLISSAMGETTNEIQREYGLESLIALLVYITIYIGLRKKNKWVVPLILIGSACSLFWIFLRIFTPADNIAMIVSKLIDVILLFFFIYQISFFRKKEVKSYFSTSGVEFFI